MGQLLIAREIIKPAGRGYVRFAIPYVGDYLANQFVSVKDDDPNDEWET